jgi:Xaa-Pro aminopeptidase
VKQDLDRLMRERGLAGLVVFAQDRYSPAMYYVTGQRLHYGLYFRSSAGRELLIHDAMERDQAALAGCPHASFAEYKLIPLTEEEGQPARAFGRLIAERCQALGITGPIALSGDVALGYADVLVSRMREIEPKLTIDATYPDIVTLARTTKETREIHAIHDAARGTVSALERVREFLEGLRYEGDLLHHDGAGPVTLGHIRRLLQEEFLAHGLAETGGESIVSQGRDAGVPHNRGNDHEALRPHVPLLIDIFPGEAGGGYHSDVTRTFCVGKAPDALRKLYDDVHAAHRAAMTQLELGASCARYQDIVCDVFEQRGHATQRTKPGTEEGYVHGLGHGVGLSVHEGPRMAGGPSNPQVLEPGMVITIEPGLYYPSKGLGVRIEDLVVAHADGTFENLTPASYELEVHPLG